MSQDATEHLLHRDSSKPPAAPVCALAQETSSLPLFLGVDANLVNTVGARFSAVQCRAGAVLMREGDAVEKLYVIGRGIVELTRVDGGQEVGVLLLSSKDVILPAAALFEEPALVTVRALTSVKLLEVEIEVIRDAFEHSTQLSTNLMKAISGHWRMAVRNILDLNCRTAAQRLGAFLLRLADLQKDSGSPMLPIAKRHLAARLGMTPETLSRTLQTVADHGLHLRGHAIIIHDRRRIEDFCGPDPYQLPDERPLNVYAM